MTRIQDINSLHWQPKLGALGAVVTGVDDIDQCIRVILSTPKGADPLRVEFGSDLYLYMDWPIDRATPHVIRESVDAIRRWEPRVEVVTVRPEIEEAHLTIYVQWRFADGVLQTTRAVVK